MVNDVKTLAEDLLTRLSKQRNHGEFCDVQLTNGISKVWSHSCVLATVSPFILRYFVANLERTAEWSVQNPIQINISTLTKCKGESKNNCMECVADTVEFIYSGKIKLRENHLDHIINLSSNLELENLLSICRKYKKDSSKVESQDFACDSCGYCSQNEEQFLMHDMIFHKEIFTCLTCNFEDPSISKIIEHTSKCKSLICPICLFNAENMSILNQHVEEHKNSSPFVCSRCSSRFQERKEWLGHFSVCQKTIKSCPVCKFSFPDDLIYEKHIKVFHKNKYTCLSCEYNTYKIDKIVNHLKISDHLELFCSICLQEMNSKNELDSHLEDHLEKLPFKCKPCRVSYPNRRQWWRHMSSHYDEKPFSCSHCHLKFKNKVHLNTHHLRIHKKKTYICSVCGLAAPFPSLLEKHQKSHLTKKEEYACLKCDFKSKYKNHFIKHKKEHKDPPKRDKKNLQCSICKIYFSLEKNLNRHMKFQHNSQAHQYKCPKCNYFSVRLDKIKDHCVKVHCMDEETSNAVTKSLKVTVPVKPLVAEDKNDESHQKALERLEDESAKVVQLRIQENGQVIVENIEEKTSGNRRHLEMGEDGSIILKDIDSRNKNYSELNMEELESSVIRELTNRQDYSYKGSQKDVRLDDQVKKTLFLNQSTGEINIISSSQGAIPIANVTATNYLTIGNFREGTGSVTLNETTGVLTFNNINSGSTGAVFLNESTGELSYIELNQNASEEHLQPEYKEIEQTQLDEVTGEIIKVNKETEETDDIFDFDMDYFNEDSFDGFDDFDELLFDNVGTESGSEHPDGYNEIQKFMMPGSQTPRLDEMTGELTFAESHSSSQNLWNEFKSFTENSEDNNSSYNSFLDEITGEFYK